MSWETFFFVSLCYIFVGCRVFSVYCCFAGCMLLCKTHAYFCLIPRNFTCCFTLSSLNQSILYGCQYCWLFCEHSEVVWFSMFHVIDTLKIAYIIFLSSETKLSFPLAEFAYLDMQYWTVSACCLGVLLFFLYLQATSRKNWDAPFSLCSRELSCTYLCVLLYMVTCYFCFKFKTNAGKMHCLINSFPKIYHDTWCQNYGTRPDILVLSNEARKKKSEWMMIIWSRPNAYFSVYCVRCS